MFGTWSDQNPFLVKVLKSSWPPFVPPFFDFPRFDLPVFQAAMTQWETSGFRVIGRLAKSIHGEVAKMVGGWGMLGKLLVLHPSKWVHPSSKWINIKFWGFQHGFNSTHIYIIIYIYCIYIYIIYTYIYTYTYHCTPISKPIQLLQPSNNGTRSGATCQLMCVHVESTTCRVESQVGTHHKDKDSNSCFSTAPEPKQWRLEVVQCCPLEKFLSPTLPTVLTEQNLHSIATSY
jgi:hypothetical protein